jgi:hypothetical protein
MATAVLSVYFEAFSRGRDPDQPLLVQTYTPNAGWVATPRPYPPVTPALVQQLAADGVTKVHVNAYNHTADFGVHPAGPINPAYLT